MGLWARQPTHQAGSGSSTSRGSMARARRFPGRGAEFVQCLPEHRVEVQSVMAANAECKLDGAAILVTPAARKVPRLGLKSVEPILVRTPSLKGPAVPERPGIANR